MNPSVGLLVLVLLSLSQALSVPEDVPDDEDTMDITTGILTSNNGSNQALFEGDLVYPTNRNLMMCWSGSTCRWPKQSSGQVLIPYTLSNSFSNFEKDKIRRAMEDFHTKTCIRFVPWARQFDYISVESGQGCYSSVGRSGGKQVLSLKRVGCLHKGIIQHELNHALGFQHEQTRSDRDLYIKVHWGNIQFNMAHNFMRHRTINLQTPYDYSSIMHYGKYAFAKYEGQPSLSPIPDPTVPVGQRQRMSQWDVIRINRAYRC